MAGWLEKMIEDYDLCINKEKLNSRLGDDYLILDDEMPDDAKCFDCCGRDYDCRNYVALGESYD